MARILIIDDDPQVLDMLQQTLERERYDVVTAANGEEGIRRYRENPTDVIITDLIMPDKEGLELIMELGRDYPDAKFIVISGGGRIDPQHYLGIAKHLGACYTFAKPVERKALLNAVKKLLEQ